MKLYIFLCHCFQFLWIGFVFRGSLKKKKNEKLAIVTGMEAHTCK